MEDHPDVVDGSQLPDRQTPLSWEELIMILSTGYGFRCAGGLQRALEQRQDGVVFGDSLAVPFGFPHMVCDLENEGAIRKLEDPLVLAMTQNHSAVQINQTIYLGLSELLQPTSDTEQWNERTSKLRQHLELYTRCERDTICKRFTDGVLECLMKLLCTSDGDNAALFLIRRNSKGVRDRTGYGGIGKVGKGSTSCENIWKEIVVLPKELESENLGKQYTRQALVGLLTFYRNLAEHQNVVERL
jgi:hypothetical protein